MFVFLLGGVNFFLSLSLTSTKISSDVDVGVGEELIEWVDVGTLADRSALFGFVARKKGLERVELCWISSGNWAIELVDEHLHYMINKNALLNSIFNYSQQSNSFTRKLITKPYHPQNYIINDQIHPTFRPISSIKDRFGKDLYLLITLLFLPNCYAK